MVYDHYTAQADHPGAPLSEPSSNGQHDASGPNPDWDQVGDFFQRWYTQAPGIYELAFTPQGGGKLYTGYADNPVVALSLVQTAYTSDFWAGVYIILNPLERVPEGRTLNGPMQGANTRATNDMVARRYRLLIDADAVSDARGTDEMATDAEQAEALALRDRVRRGLETLGWPDPAHVTSSGNGGGLIYRVACR